MIKLPIEDFKEEIKAEIVGYEELGEEAALKWEENFTKWLTNSSIKKKRVKVENGKTFFVFKDESELFNIADSYWAAVENDEVAEYWSKFD